MLAQPVVEQAFGAHQHRFDGPEGIVEVEQHRLDGGGRAEGGEALGFITMSSQIMV
jgi:hypothetical protein